MQVTAGAVTTTTDAILKRFTDAMAAHDTGDGVIAVAVSGGGDSMALACLMHDWMTSRGGRIVALTVDHGLRAESADEARRTAAILAARGIAHDVLHWRGDKPQTHIQEEARRARYDLLLAACRDRGIRTLAVAHNAEDQMETFWMRLAHGSGIDGLAGMAPRRDVGGVAIIRPLLSFGRAELRAYCDDAGCPYIDDPSNGNDRFLRVRLRTAEDVLAAEGLTPQRLSLVLQKIADARDSLRYFEDISAASCLSFPAGGGFAVLDLSSFSVFPVDMRRRLLARAIAVAAPQSYPVPFAQLDDLDWQISASADGFSGVTLAGAEIFSAGGRIYFCREAVAVSAMPVTATDTVWDGRFTLRLAARVPSARMDILGDAGLALLRKNKRPLPAWPAKVLRALPAMWVADQPVFVPALDYYDALLSAEAAKPVLLPAKIV